MKFYERYIPDSFYFMYFFTNEKGTVGVDGLGLVTVLCEKDDDKVSSSFKEISPCRELISLAKLYGVY